MTESNTAPTRLTAARTTVDRAPPHLERRRELAGAPLRLCCPSLFAVALSFADGGGRRKLEQQGRLERRRRERRFLAGDLDLQGHDAGRRPPNQLPRGLERGEMGP